MINKEQIILAKHWLVCFKNKEKLFYSLQGLLKLEITWITAYRNLKGRQSRAGPDNENMTSLIKTRIMELRQAVMDGKYEWRGSKQVMVPKPDSTGKGLKGKVLGIPSDRLVEEALKIILEPIFELAFNKQSFGFRPGRNSHTALKWVRTQMKAQIWYVEADLKNYFGDHTILMAKIEKRVRDPLILKLLAKGLKAKIFAPSGFVWEKGSILSPLLSNLYLDDFDSFMETLAKRYQGPASKRRVNPEYNRLMKSGLKKEVRKRRIPVGMPRDEKYRNCKYIRYADDFIVGILGPREMAVEIKNEIKNFLKERLKIELNLEKTRITHIKEKIKFLGYFFTRRTFFGRKANPGGKIVSMKMSNPILDVDMLHVIPRLKKVGFCDDKGNPTPAFRYLRLPQAETNMKVNEIIRGYSEWFSIAGNRRSATARIAYIIRYSIAKVYAAKFKLKTVAAVFKIGRNNLSSAIGKKRKSILGVDVALSCKQGEEKTKSRIEPILFDRYHSIPQPKSKFLEKNWEPDYIKRLRSTESAEELWKVLPIS
jgi:group II intron reverse transcriptase/maturase